MLPLAFVGGSRQKVVVVLVCLAVTFTFVSALKKYDQDTKHVAAKRQLYDCVPSSEFERCNQYGDVTATSSVVLDPATCNCLNGSACDANGFCAKGCAPGWSGPGCRTGNVALGKPAQQSSLYNETIYVGSADRAVDGNWYLVDVLTPTYCSHTQVGLTSGTSWLAVTLDTTRYYVIISMTLINRLGSLSVRLSNFVLLYSNATNVDPNPLNSIWREYAREPGTVGFNATYTSNSTVIAKRVAIYLTASAANLDAILTVCEFQIYGYPLLAIPAGTLAALCHCLNGSPCDANGVCTLGCDYGWYGPCCQTGNLALGKPALQSSTYYSYNSADQAVDGIIYNDTSTTSCTHTTPQTTANPTSWWVVTLDTTRNYVTTSVTLVNRVGSWSYRLSNFVILYTNTTVGDPDPSNSSWREYARETGTVGYSSTYTGTVIARRFAVYLYSTVANNVAILTLCEVQIYGYEPFDTTAAFSRMSAAAPWTVSGWTPTDPCCPYVYFDFGGIYKVCGFESASAVSATTFVNLEVRVGNSTTKNGDGFFVNPVCTFVNALTSGVREFYPCRNFMFGRYISFMLVGAAVPGPLTVSYFKVFASI